MRLVLLTIFFLGAFGCGNDDPAPSPAPKPVPRVQQTPVNRPMLHLT